MQAVLRHGAVALPYQPQVIHRHAGQVAGGVGLLPVQLIQDDAAGEGALGLAHGDGGHLLAVPGHGGGHQKAVGRMKGKSLYTVLVVDLHSGLVAPLVEGHRQAALPGQGNGQNLAAAGDFADQALGIEDIHVAAADVVGGGQAAGSGHCTGGPLYSLVADHLAVLLHHQQLAVGDDGQAAVQRGKAAGAVGGVVVQLGAAGLVLFGPGIGHAAAQPVEGGGIRQGGDEHHRQQHHGHRRKPYGLQLRPLPALHPAGRLLLEVALVKFHPVH